MWFNNILPDRIDELLRAIQRTPGFETWAANFTPDSLGLLGIWFANQVDTRPRTQEEMLEIANQSSFPKEIPNVELTNRTFSIAFDIGFYLSQVLLKNNPSLKWDQAFKGKRYVDYGQPVLMGFGVVPFNPVRMMVVLAYGLADKMKTGGTLREIYNIWVQMIKA